MKYIDLSEDYPEVYELAREVMMEFLFQGVHNLPEMHAKIFSRILGEGYFKLLSDYRLHVVNDSIRDLILVVFIPAEDDDLPSVIYK